VSRSPVRPSWTTMMMMVMVVMVMVISNVTEHYNHTFSLILPTTSTRQFYYMTTDRRRIKALEMKLSSSVCSFSKEWSLDFNGQGLTTVMFHLPTHKFAKVCKFPKFPWWQIRKTLASCFLKNSIHIWIQIIAMVKFMLWLCQKGNFTIDKIRTDMQMRLL
jgi:hypothetical protein